MGAINMHEKYSTEILRKFDHESHIGNNTNQTYKFDGVKSITISTPSKMDVVDYKRTGTDRFGELKEIEDTIQHLTVTQDKAFTGSIDEGNKSDQQKIKVASEIIKDQSENVIGPWMDRYAFRKWADNAGLVKGMAKPTEKTIVAAIFDATAEMSDKLVPPMDRRIYMTPEAYNLVRKSPEFITNHQLGSVMLTKSMPQGTIAGCEVVVVPSSILPKDVYFLIVHKSAVIFPKKIAMTRILDNQRGVHGSVLEGRFYFDAFVLGERSDGVYAAVPTAEVLTAPEIQINSNNATVTSAGNVIYITTDESDPRYSATAKIYSGPVKLEPKQVIKACAKKDGKYTSPVATKQND